MALSCGFRRSRALDLRRIQPCKYRLMPGRAILNAFDPTKAKIPRDVADPKPFDEPWQAELFALVVGLHEKGVFGWSDWAECLSAQLHKPDAALDGSDYYERWLLALESLLSRQGLAGSEELDTLQAAWRRAAHATLHGQPIRLENDPAIGGG